MVICCPQAGRAHTFTLDAKVCKTSRQKNAPTTQTQRLPRFFADPALLRFFIFIFVLPFSFLIHVIRSLNEVVAANEVKK